MHLSRRAGACVHLLSEVYWTGGFLMPLLASGLHSHMHIGKYYWFRMRLLWQ